MGEIRNDLKLEGMLIVEKGMHISPEIERIAARMGAPIRFFHPNDPAGTIKAAVDEGRKKVPKRPVLVIASEHSWEMYRVSPHAPFLVTRRRGESSRLARAPPRDRRAARARGSGARPKGGNPLLGKVRRTRLR